MKCECPSAGWCQRRKAEIPASMHRACVSGNGDAVDAMLAAIENGRATRPKIDPSKSRGYIGPLRRKVLRYGDRLAAIIHRETGEQISCSDCQNEIGRLNTLSKEAIAQQAAALADTILQRGQQRARAWWQRWACKISPLLVRRSVLQWIHEAIDAPLIEITEYSTKTRHLTMHVWPTSWHHGWQWNIQQIAKRIELFNGKRILGVSTDRKTASADAVVQYARECGVEFSHVIVRPNSRSIREVQTWLPMLDALGLPHMPERDVVFSCHAKGVRHDQHGGHVEAWADLMYQSCLDYWPLVDQQMRQFIATGSFKRYGTFATPGNKKWHYSGTFFWWRPHVFQQRQWRNVDKRFFGTESWLGLHAYPDETGVLFCDHVGDLYDANYWKEVIWPLWENWKSEADSFHVERDGSILTRSN